MELKQRKTSKLDCLIVAVVVGETANQEINSLNDISFDFFRFGHSTSPIHIPIPWKTCTRPLKIIVH